MNSIFITGTGTDIGKTGVSLALCVYLDSLGLKTAYFKPVQCGTFPLPNGLPGGDGDWVKLLYPGNIEVVYSYFFRDPVSPHLASEREKNPIDSEKIRSDLKNLQKKYDIVVVEGAGGVAVPLDYQGLTLFDVLNRGELSSLLVASPHLGTLNHSLLAYHFMDKRGGAPSGFVMAHVTETISDIVENNIVTLEKLTRMNLFGQMPYVSNLQSVTRLNEPALAQLQSCFNDDFKNWILS